MPFWLSRKVSRQVLKPCHRLVARHSRLLIIRPAALDRRKKRKMEKVEKEKARRARMVLRTSGISPAINSGITESVLGRIALMDIVRNCAVVTRLAETRLRELCATSLISRRRLTPLLLPPAKFGIRNSLRNNLRLLL